MTFTPLLRIENLQVQYGRIAAVRGLSLAVGQGEIVGVIGPNGAGKTSTLAAVTGIAPTSGGSIDFDGKSLVGLAPEAIVRRGLALVPEGRQIFLNLTVEENLRLGGTVKRDGSSFAEHRERVLEKFPVLRRYYGGMAGQLSGGEQQQLAIARSLLSRPRLLLLDEPSLGLAPRVVNLVFEVLADLRAEGTTILLAEQIAGKTVELADRTYVLKGGEVVISGTRDELMDNADITSAYLGLNR